MSQARVLHVFKYFRPRFTGEGIFVERLAPIFARLRPDVAHEVAVTVTGRPDHYVLPADLAAIHYLSTDGAGTSQAALILWLARNARRYAAVHYHTHVDRTFLASALLRFFGRRVLLSATLDDSVPGILRTYRPVFRPLVRRLACVVGRFIAISRKLFEENNRVIARAKSELVPIGIGIPALRPDARAAGRKKLGIDTDAAVLVCVGGICPRKDQLFLVRQLPALLRRHPRLLLVLVGPILDTTYKAEIDHTVASCNLESNVRFAGFAEAPWDFYAAADLMVFSSGEEGFGTVVIEAMAHGLPVVVRHLPGVNDMFVEHGMSGYLFTQADDYQRYVGDLLAAPGLRAQVGAAGRAFVSNHYDISKVAARYLALYGFPAEGKAT